uniref:Uncharacterized protein n=1 Tax=Piliocolobus tephrosceles TaxID=591936 RepID=A0A8C9GJU1_9PRIM
MMEFRLTPCNLFNPTNYHRPIPSNTLLTRYLLCLLLNRTYYPRCKLRLNYSLSPCLRCLYILYLPLSTYRPRPILRLIPSSRNLKHQRCTSTYNYSNSFHRLRTPMGSNIILRCHSNYKFIISNSIHRN